MFRWAVATLCIVFSCDGLLCSGDEDEGGASIVDRLKECPNKLFSAQLW